MTKKYKFKFDTSGSIDHDLIEAINIFLVRLNEASSPLVTYPSGENSNKNKKPIEICLIVKH